MATDQLGKRKVLSESYVPQHSTNIAVCWLLEGAQIWWTAKVTDVEEYDEAINGNLGKGRLLYKPMKEYPSEDASVYFKFSKLAGRILTQQYNGETLTMSWKPMSTRSKRSIADPSYEDEQENIRGSSSRFETKVTRTVVLSKDPSEPQVRKSRRLTTRAKSKVEESTLPLRDPMKREEQVDDIPHNASKSDEVSAQQKVKTNTDEIEIDTTENTVNLVSAKTDTDSEVRVNDKRQEVIFQHEASGFFRNLVTSNQELMESMNISAFHDSLAKMVIHELRVYLVSELHKNFRPSTTVQSTDGDMQQKCLRLSVSCTLHTFSSIAKRLRESSSASAVRFFPSFAQTQTPSISSERFTVYFNSLKSLGQALGFNDNRDFCTLHWREKCHDNVFYTRILGCIYASDQTTSSSTPVSAATNVMEKKSSTTSTAKMIQKQPDEDDEDKKNLPSANNTHGKGTDLIFLGLSMNAEVNEINQEYQREKRDDEGNEGNCNDNRSYVALCRTRALWDEESHAYISRWDFQKGSIQVEPPPPSFFSRRDKKLDGVFALRWEPRPQPRTSAWTADALRSDSHVFGKLEVFVPWVLLTGDQCTDIGDLLSKMKFSLRP